MPIEIRELHIKAVIDTAGSKPAAEGGAGNTGNQPAAGAASPDAEQLIDLCVEKVMEILKEKKER
jgi:hypothetical protein